MKEQQVETTRWIVSYGGKASKDRKVAAFSVEESAVHYYNEKIRDGMYANIFVEYSVIITKKVV